jgi:4-hydroxy-3-methylbut-2-enyl diphosphate reductase
LADQSKLLALGPLIHNERELERLGEIGLETIEQDSVERPQKLRDLKDRTLFIRTHGLSPHIREKLQRAGAVLIDGTCPRVRRVQELIEQHYSQGFQILIVGKAEHPEVLGLLGHCDQLGVVLEKESDLTGIDYGRPSLLIAQTTVNPAQFQKWKQMLSERIEHLIDVDTTCPQINARHEKLRAFAASVDVLLMVGGSKSSNTGVLFEICKAVNPRSYRIERPENISDSWLLGAYLVGVTGSASTPYWQLKDVKTRLQEFAFEGI